MNPAPDAELVRWASLSQLGHKAVIQLVFKRLGEPRERPRFVGMRS